MSHITLIRHGQANSQALTEEDYDRLSPLGAQQSTWLGNHLKSTNGHHARLYTGTLRRHAETATAMDTGLEPVRDARLNELEYFTMAKAMEAEHGVPAPEGPSEFVHHFPRVLKAWHDDQLDGAPEPFAAFEARVGDALRDISKGDGPALVVTSGGLIGMAMRLHLGLDISGMAQMILAIMNTSMHRLYPVGGRWSPTMFNAVPHLEHPERHHAQTHV